MTDPGSEPDTDNARPFRDWMPRRARRLHRSVIALPQLESEFAGMLDLLARSKLNENLAQRHHYALSQSLAGLRSELGRGFRALSELRRGLERDGCDDQEIERRLSQRLKGVPGGEELLARVRNAGGLHKALRRVSLVLLRRYDAYGDCLRILQHRDPIDVERFGGVVDELIDHMPARPPDAPDSKYAFLCAAGPLGLLLTAAVVVAVIIATEDEIDPDPPDNDDDGEPDGEDPDAGICEGELEPDAGICVPQ